MRDLTGILPPATDLRVSSYALSGDPRDKGLTMPIVEAIAWLDAHGDPRAEELEQQLDGWWAAKTDGLRNEVYPPLKTTGVYVNGRACETGAFFTPFELAILVAASISTVVCGVVFWWLW